MPARFRIVGTAGHIDHGKSALVRALTGTDPDRLQEEKDRGITIDLGFAHLDLSEDLRVGFIDAPGHERFVKNMLAGIGGIDAALLVIAADESIMPQTREHLAICELLGIAAGVVAITKRDLVDAEIVDLVELEVREFLAGTFLAGAAIVKTSVATGEGLDALREALGAALTETPTRPAEEPARMPVDRIFTVRGFGTVATGTLLAGSVSTGDTLQLLPAGDTVTVRGVQAYGASVDAALAGQRTALNLQGVDVEALSRGDLLVSPGSIATTYLIDARLQMLGGCELEQLQRVRFHHGAAEILCRVAILDADGIPEGGAALVQLRLEAPYAVVPVDRFVIRRYSPMITIGGGVVIDSLPVKHRGSDAAVVETLRALQAAGPAERLSLLVEGAREAGLGEAEMCRRLGTTSRRVRETAAEAARDGRVQIVQEDPLFVVARAAFDSVGSRAVELLERYHDAHPLRPGMPKSELAQALPQSLPELVLDAAIEKLKDEGRLRPASGALALVDHEVSLTAEQQRLRQELFDLYTDAGWAPPSADQAQRSLGDGTDSMLRHLLREGELVRLRDGLIYASSRLEELVEELRRRHPAGEPFSVAEFKDWAGISRKHAIPLLEHLDQLRVTRRVGDKRERI